MVYSKKKYSTLIILLISVAFLFLIIPAQAADSLVDKINVSKEKSGYVYDLNKGEYDQDLLKVYNESGQTLDLIIYTADSTPTSDGQLAFKQKRQRMNDIGSWIRFYPQSPPSTTGEVIEALYDYPDTIASIEDRCAVVQVPIGVSYESYRDYLYKELQDLIPDPEFIYLEALTRWCDGVPDYQFKLEPGEETSIPFVIIIPREVEPGEHTGGILIEEAQPAVISNLIGSGQTERLAVSVTEIVPGEIIREVAVTSFSAEADENNENYEIKIDLQNDGNVSQELEVAIVINNKLIDQEDFIERQSITVLRNSPLSVSFSWPVPKIGKFGLKANITVDTLEGREVISTPELELVFVPWLEIFLLGGLFILIIIILIYWRMRHKDKLIMDTWKLYTVKRNDTLEYLAEKCRISKKQIIKVNEIGRPYQLVPGQKILLPLPIESAVKKISAKSANNKLKIPINKIKSLDGASNIKAKPTKIKDKPQSFEPPQKNNKRSWLISIIIIIVGVVVSVSVVRFARNNGENSTDTINQNVPTDKINNETENKNDTPVIPPLESTSTEQTGESAGVTISEKVIEEKIIKPNGVELWVLNGSGIPGLASKMSEQLKNVGFPVTYVGNAEHFGYVTTTVFYQLADDRKKAEFVSLQLKELGYINIKIENNIDIKNISVVIGSEK